MSNNPYLKDDNSYYYGYGYNQAGYGYGGYDTGSHRTIKDYLLIFRERIWFFIPTFFLFVAGSILYTVNATEIYRSATTVQVLRDDPRILATQDIESSEIRGAEDFNTQVKLMESMQIVDLVDKRLQGETRRRFLAPYEEGRGGTAEDISVGRILAENRTIEPIRMSFIVTVMFEHPDAKIAAQVANMFAEEFIRFSLRQTLGLSNKAVEDLKRRADDQRSKVKNLEMRLAQYKEDKNSISIDADENIMKQEIQRLNDIVVSAKSDYDFFATRIQQIEEAEDSPEAVLYELPFVSSNEKVSQLRSVVTDQKINIAQLAKRYREKHPKMIQAREALRESEMALEQAVRSAIEETRSRFREASRNYNSAMERLTRQEKALIELGKERVEFNAIQSELEVEKAFYQALVSRMTQELAQTELKNSQIRIIDPAVEPRKPYKPRTLLNLAIGGFLGLTGGFGLVFLVAFLDDRVKTAYDVESVVGLPLIGIIPRLRKLDASEKAQAVASGADRHVTEAFRTIHSSLRLGEDSKNAKTILATSTVPGEGKSFLSTNIAFTLASHGERTLLLDCDLRLPNVGKSLQLDLSRGLVNYFEDDVPIDDLIQRDFVYNMDILPAGGKAKNPTQILNSPKFGELLGELKERYDKIIIDSPPLAAVSDALNLLPLVDGVLYVIKFNTVKRKTAKLNVKRLWDSSTPVFGAIMNNISNNISSYYYSHYYDRSYRDYYAQAERREAQAEQGGKNTPVPAGPPPSER